MTKIGLVDIRRAKRMLSTSFVRCVLCGDTKKYKTPNKRRCPERYTHRWRVYYSSDEAHSAMIARREFLEESGD